MKQVMPRSAVAPRSQGAGADTNTITGSGLSAAAADTDWLASGSLLGCYQIIRSVGAGGMATVYLARDTRLGRRVAVKVLAASHPGASAPRRRFRREARTLAALNHPNIPALFDTGESNGNLWLIMEFVEGSSLRKLLRRGALPTANIVTYGFEIAKALQHAHCRRVVHRDVKPDNIVIAKDGSVKLLDFGLATAGSDKSASGSYVTAPGSFIGTLQYAPPELILGGAARARSDIYSFGILLHEMACGEPPLARLQGQALLAAIVNGDLPRTTNRNPSLPPSICTLIERCTALDPNARFANGEQLVRAFGELAGNTSTPLQAGVPQPPAIAVVDFRNLSGDGNLDWLGVAIAETITTHLAQLDVRLVRPLRLQRRRPRPRVAAESAWAGAASGLGARWLITGSFQNAAEKIRVTSEVIDVLSADVIAARIVDGCRHDLLELQDRVGSVLLADLPRSAEGTARHKILLAGTET